MYVEFIKNFILADPSELVAVRLILASWAQKHLIPSFLLADRSELMAVRLILASWAQNFLLADVWFLLSRHDVRPAHEKFSSRRFQQADGS